MRWQICRSVSKTGIWTTAICNDGKYLNFLAVRGYVLCSKFSRERVMAGMIKC